MLDSNIPSSRGETLSSLILKNAVIRGEKTAIREKNPDEAFSSMQEHLKITEEQYWRLYDKN